MLVTAVDAGISAHLQIHIALINVMKTVLSSALFEDVSVERANIVATSAHFTTTLLEVAAHCADIVAVCDLALRIRIVCRRLLLIYRLGHSVRYRRLDATRLRLLHHVGRVLA